MLVRRMQHYNIRTPRFEESIRFYVDVLGMRSAPPAMPAGVPAAVRDRIAAVAAWIFDATGEPVVHMARVDPDDAATQARLNAHLGERDLASLHGSGAIDHIGFEAEDYEGAVERLGRLGCAFTERVTSIGARQIFVHDPNDIKIELNFVGADAGRAA